MLECVKGAYGLPSRRLWVDLLSGWGLLGGACMGIPILCERLNKFVRQLRMWYASTTFRMQHIEDIYDAIRETLQTCMCSH